MSRSRLQTKTGSSISHRQIPDFAGIWEAETVDAVALWRSIGIQPVSGALGPLRNTSVMLMLHFQQILRVCYRRRLTPPFLVQPPVQLKRSADQRQMRKCLRKIAQMLARRAQLFCEEAQVIGVTQHLLEQESGSFCVVTSGQTFDQPERTHAESSFGSHQAVFCPVPIHQ